MSDPQEVLNHYYQEEKDEILNMSVGRELDALVAEKVMGIKVKSFYSPNGLFYYDGDKFGFSEIPNYNKQMHIAWGIVEKMRDTHVYELADFGRNTHKQCQHYAAFHPINEPRDYKRQVRAKTAPEAICKAALLVALDEKYKEVIKN